MPRQESGQSTLQDHIVIEGTPPASPERLTIEKNIKDQMNMNMNVNMHANSTNLQQNTSAIDAPKYDCSHYHSLGHACLCHTRYAAKVGRKATERILSKSKFFSERNVLIQNEEERMECLLDESNHSTANQILQLDAHSVSLGRVLGKGGFCVVYEAEIPERLVKSTSTSVDDVSTSVHGTSTTVPPLTKSNSNMSARSAAKAHKEVGESDHHSSGSDSAAHVDYCVKFLKTNVLPEKKKFARGIADLAIEAHFLASLNHPHILKIRGVPSGFTLFEPSSPSFLSTLTNKPGLEGGCFLLLDRLSMTLDTKINANWKEIQLKWNSFFHRTVQDIRGAKRRLFRLERINVALQLSQAMQYLHQHHICYRDLKPDNIGFDSHDSLKLFDFGLAKELKDYKRHADGTYQLTANTGSKRYMAPEVASRNRYNLSVDVFSFGILFWEICALEKPFDGFTELQHMNLVVQRGHRPRMDVIKCWPLSVRHIISRCWHPISNERPSFRQVVNALIQVQHEMTESL